jgi:hypothetical protein
MITNRKRAMSMRMTVSDVSKVKKLARRLGVRDSDVIRFAVKGALERFWPLCDSKLRGQELVPLFVELGPELVRFFEIDATRLAEIINDGADTGRRVDQEDVVLLALSISPHSCVMPRLGGFRNVDSSRATPSVPSPSLREYLYQKYVYAPTEVSSVDADRLIASGG